MSERKQYGIAVFHHIGDVLCSTPIAKQLKADDPNCHITWFTSHAGEVSVRHNPHIDEIIVLEGDQYALDGEIPNLRNLKDWARFFAPAAYLNYEAIPGGSIMNPKGTIFGIVKSAAKLNWTVPFTFPFVLSSEEKLEAERFWENLPAGIKILVETDYRSEQSPWRDDWNYDLLDEFRDLDPVFVFTAKNRPPFLERFQARHPKSLWCHLPFRLNAELFNRCDAFVGVSSGLSCLTYSEYCRTDVPRIEVTRGEHWGAAELPHHKALFLCYSRKKYLESLKRLKGILLKRECVPDFTPRLDPASRFSGHCPACGDYASERAREGLLHCMSCDAAYSVAPLAKVENPLSLVLKGNGPNRMSAEEFISSDSFEENQYDSILLEGNLGSIVHVQEFIEKLQFVLKPEGSLQVSAPNFAGVLSASLREKWSALGEGGTLWFFTPLFLRELLIQAGFWIERSETSTPAKDRLELKSVLANVRPDLHGNDLETFIDEIDRREGGNITSINARKRGAYKGRAADAPTKPLPTSRSVVEPSSRVPLVSVIIPCFNQAHTLCEAVESVAVQSHKNLETIVVDDGSSDATSELAGQLAGRFPSVGLRLIRSPHRGTAEARDRAISEARGEWVVPLDSDDTLGAEFIARTLMQANASPSTAIVYTQLQQFGLGTRIWEPGPFNPESILSGYFPPSIVLLKRTFWSTFGGFCCGVPFAFSHYHMWLSLLEWEGDAAYIPEPLANYRIARSGQAHHGTNPCYRLAMALYRSVHPRLFSSEELRREHSIIAEAGETLIPLLAKQILDRPTDGLVYFWRGLIAESSGNYQDAMADYALAESRCSELNWQPAWKKLSLAVEAFGEDRFLLDKKERELNELDRQRGRSVSTNSNFAGRPL